MNILITGGVGHIGSSLLKNLNKINNLKYVYIIDNLRSNNVNVLFNLRVKKNVNIKFIKEDLINTKKLIKIKKKIDIVIHLASITNVANSFSIKNILFENNFGIFKNIVNFCIKNNSKLIHLSSTSVYGLQSELIDEKNKHLAPQSPYAEEKVLEENYLKKNSKKIRYVTLRLGTITGISKGMRFHTAVNKFCFNAIIGEDIPIWGKALNLYRPYLSLKDAIRTIIFLINNNKFNNEIYNIVTNNYTVKEILNLIKKNNYKIKTKVIKSPIINQQSFKVSNKKIHLLGLKLGKSIKRDIYSTLKLLEGLY